MLNRIVKKHRRESLHEITTKFNNNKQHSFSSRTIRRKLASEGYKRPAAKKCVVVREVNRKKRVAWCRGKRNWTVDSHWRKYIYTDESQIVARTNNCIDVWRKGAEVNRSDLVCRPSLHKVIVMIWGYLSFSGIGTLTDVKGNINFQIYIDVLENNLWPVIARYFADTGYVFQDDNAPVHRARITENYKQENNMNCTTGTWPAQSPDLNVCENVWLHIKREIQPIAENINIKKNLIAEIRRVWESLPVNYIQRLYQTIPTRIREVIRMKGHLT